MEEKNKPHLWIPTTNTYDENITVPGGGRSFSRDNYKEHGNNLLEQIKHVTEEIVKKKDLELSQDYIIQINTPEEEPIKQHRLKLNNLGFQILSYSNENNNSATAKIDKTKFSEFNTKVNRYAKEDNNPGKTNIAVIDSITDVPLVEKIANDIEYDKSEFFDCIITLYNVLSQNEKEAIIESISNTLVENGIQSLKKKKFLNGTMIVSAKLNYDIVKEIGSHYITVKSITKNRNALIRKSIPAATLPSYLTVNSPLTDSIVAVVDSGVNQASIAFSSLVVNSYPYLPKGTIGLDMDHGSLVASRVLYGDNIDNNIHSLNLTPYCRIVDIPIFGLDSNGDLFGPSEDELIDILDEIVPKLSNMVKVFNLSLGFDYPISQFKFSLLANELDFLSREYNVLFVVAAGNISRPIGTPPNHFLNSTSLIQPPAESLLSLTVGSVAKYYDTGCLSRENEISAFSCRGPGADNGIKPEVVAHGGNILSSWGATPRIGAYGIYSSGAHLAYDVGTSFAAPIISQYAARLFSIYPNASVNLVKALICHFSYPVNAPQLPNINSKDYYGFGEPNIEKALYATENSMAFLHEGVIKPETYKHIKFHIPNTLAADEEDTKLKVRVTLVYNPPVNPDNHLEYSLSRISLSLNKNTTNSLVQVTGQDTEVSYNLPWNPIIHLEKEFTRSYLTGEWEIRLRMMTRGNLPETYEQNFAVIIEVIDSNGNTNVYNDVTNEFVGIYLPTVLRRVA